MKPIIPSDFSLPLLRRERVAKDAYSFYFDRTQNPEFTFYPGQYNRVILLHESPDQRGSSRNFTIASSPNNRKELVFTTRVVESSFKKALFSITPGTEVEFFGPVGRFVFDETDISPHVFFSGGIGITPFHAMITYIQEKHITTPIILFAAFSRFEDLLYYDEFAGIAAKHPSIKIVYVITRVEHIPKNWRGEFGKVSPDMIKKYVPNIAECITMTCGPMAMVEATVEMLATLGVSKENVRRESFVGYS
jgi:ferredoxin-NADP reductase